MTLEPEAIAQLLIGILLGVIGWNIRQILYRLENLEVGQNRNGNRLVRIETRLGLQDNGQNGYHDTA